MKTKRIFLWTAFALWCAFLLWLLIFRRLDTPSALTIVEYARGHFVWKPLSTVPHQIALAGAGDAHAMVNLAGNTLLFVPVGVLVPVLMPTMQKFWQFLLVFAAVILAVEFAQLILRVGVCEADDLLLNCVGGSAGYLLWRLFGRSIEKK